jgi:HD-like signal output (HDOD) protein
MESLPSLPEYYTQLLQELESPNASIKMVKKIVSKDMGMSAKLLQLVNSAFFGMGRKVSDPARAIIFLGLDTIKSLVMSTHVFSQFSDMKLQGVSLDTLWEHSVFCAGLAKRIALSENADDKTREDCFIAGLLHDIGKLVLASKLPQYYNCVLTIMSRNGNRLVEAEQRVFGSSHAEVGAYLLGLWGLNDSVVEAVAFHHFPDKGSAARLTPLVIIFVVNLMMKDNCLDKTRKTLTEMESPYFGDLGLNGRLQTWYDVYEQSLHSGELIDER